MRVTAEPIFDGALDDRIACVGVAGTDSHAAGDKLANNVLANPFRSQGIACVAATSCSAQRLGRLRAAITSSRRPPPREIASFGHCVKLLQAEPMIGSSIADAWAGCVDIVHVFA